MTTPKVSVVMSVYNGEKYLREAVESILNQTFRDFEFIIIDDGSTDGTAAILDSYTDPRIVRLKNETSIGLTQSLNRGLAMARGEYIARMDADDISHPQRLEKQLAAIESSDSTKLLFTCYCIIDQDGRIIQDIPVYRSPEAIYLELFFNNCLVHGTAFIEKRFLQSVGGYNESLEGAQDYELWNRVKQASRLVMLPEILYSYRDHQDAISREKIEMQNEFYWKRFRANLSILTDGQSEAWDDDFLHLLRAVGKNEVSQRDSNKAELALEGVLERIYQESPAFLDRASLEHTIAEYKQRFRASIILLPEAEMIMPKNIKEALRLKAEENLSLLPEKFFQEHQDTRVTILMLSWNRFDQTTQAIQALQDHVSIPYRLLLVDNNSDCRVREQLKEISLNHNFIDLILLEENLGCGGGRRYALDYVETEYVMFLDNDIEVFPGAIEHLLYSLESNPEIVASTGNLIFPSGLVHVCGGDYEPRNDILFYELLGAGKDFDHPLLGQSGPCRWVNGGATMFRTEILVKHPYDPLMHSYYEDFEWCYRLNQKGIGHFYRSVEALFLHHYEAKLPDASISTNEARRQSIKFIETIAYFYKTYGFIIQNLFNFVPELITSGGELNASSGKIFLEWVNTYGSEWVLDKWQRGYLAPLFSGQVETLEEWQTFLKVALPFDQYQRYKIIQEALDLLRDGDAALTILDVGGWPGTLHRFLLNDRVVVADLQYTEGVSVRADGCRLPFPDRSFDAVVSSDTFEHIPPHLRPQFLEELVRVTRGPLLLCAPFDDPQVVQAEEILQQLIVARYRERYDFIEEHRENGLPNLTETLSLLHDAGFDTIALPNGYLYHWIVGISLWFLLQWRFDDSELSARVNAFYNQSFYHQDNREPSYRKLVVAARRGEAALSHLSDVLVSPATRDPAADLMAVQVLNLLVQMLGERWSERALQAEAQLRQREAEVARLTQEHQAEVARLTQEHQAEVARLTQEHQAEVARLTQERDALQKELNTIYTSKTWHIAKKGLRVYQLAEAVARRLVRALGSTGLFSGQRLFREKDQLAQERAQAFEEGERNE